VATHVITDFYFDFGRRGQMKARIITCDCVQIAFRQPSPFGDAFQLLPRQVPKLPLDFVEFFEYSIGLILDRQYFEKRGSSHMVRPFCDPELTRALGGL
jgi:hypothetical protein